MIKSLKINLLIAVTFLFNIICSGQNDIVEKPNILFIAIYNLNDWIIYGEGTHQSIT